MFVSAIQKRANTIVDRETAIAEVVKKRRIADLSAIPDDDQVIEVNARLQSTIRQRHRQAIDATKSLFFLPLDELRVMTSKLPLVDELVQIMDDTTPQEEDERASQLRSTFERVSHRRAASAAQRC
jgi:hypothetical protein